MLLFILESVPVWTVSCMVTLAYVATTILDAGNSVVKTYPFGAHITSGEEENKCVVRYWLVTSVIKMQNMERGSARSGLG